MERLLKVPAGPVTLEQIAGSLKKIGIDHVVSAKSAADCAASTAEHMLDKALEGKISVVLSNSFAAKHFLYANFPQLQDSFVFNPTLLEEFGELAGAQMDAGNDNIEPFAFSAVGSDAKEADKSKDIHIAVNARELYRIMLRTGSEPNPKRTAELKELKAPTPAGTYGRLLTETLWSMDKESEELTVTANGRLLNCLSCHNLGQARDAMETIAEGHNKYDIIKVIG